jgi:hypothetical protein
MRTEPRCGVGGVRVVTGVVLAVWLAAGCGVPLGTQEETSAASPLEVTAPGTSAARPPISGKRS